MAHSERGLYETLVTEAMEEQLAGLDGRLQGDISVALNRSD